ncbi:MAG: DUF5320 domain-containing protein [Candidatus Hermodarchaeota archaeon]
MPGGDGTGPGGLGPRTGRALGYCAGYDTPGYTKGPGMGLGRKFGRGRGQWFGYGRGLGWRKGGWGGYEGIWGYSAPVYSTPLVPTPAYMPPTTPESQLNMLKQEKDYLEAEMKGMTDAINDIAKRIAELESKSE